MKVTTRALAVAATIVGTVGAPAAAFASDAAPAGGQIEGTALQESGTGWIDNGVAETVDGAMKANSGIWAPALGVPDQGNAGAWTKDAPWDNGGAWGRQSTRTGSDWARTVGNEQSRGKDRRAAATDCLGIAAVETPGSLCGYLPKGGGSLATKVVGATHRSIAAQASGAHKGDQPGRHSKLKPRPDTDGKPGWHHGDQGDGHGSGWGDDGYGGGGTHDGYGPPPGPPPPPPPGPPPLPTTGDPVAPLAGAGALLLVGGGALVAASRRRPSPRPRNTTA